MIEHARAGERTAISPSARFFQIAGESLRAGTFVRLRLSNPEGSVGGALKVVARWVELGSGPALSVVQSYERKDVTKNYALEEGVTWLGAEFERGYRGAFLCTVEGDWQLSKEATEPGGDGAARLIRHKASVTTVPVRQHDKPKQRMLDQTAIPWLSGLGIVDGQGKPRMGMSAKLRQIERYVEILCHVARAEDWGLKEAWTVVDYGAGKAYLTFAVWQAFARGLGRNVRVVGVEQRVELVERSRELARDVGANTLEFVAGTISQTEVVRADTVIALHACDTATDDAIGRAVRDGARWIVVAPCCQKEIRKALRHVGPLAPLLRHGILEERLAEWLTDGLRSLYLEYAGYATKVFEFVDSEHTPKNLMISAVRMGDVDASGRKRVAGQIAALKREFGLGPIAMDRWIEVAADTPSRGSVQ